jgi:hypothetical protein
VARARKQASASPKISVDNGFHKLLPTLSAHAAVELINTALRDNRARLYCNGVPVDPNFIRTHLVVEARHAADGRWSASIKPIRALAAARYIWRVDAPEIEALRPQPIEPQPPVLPEVLPPLPARPQVEALSPLPVEMPPPSSNQREPRSHRLIRKIADETWPGGWENVETRQILHDVSAVLEKRSVAVPSRDTFLRALGRRKD